ncbi:MAG TPA: type VI secretion system protein TssL, long form [Acetobacteraceae bacterium]|jgi:type VI secretion system protein ImpK|nr:type VI secretion system protein TssL, long form [Acetobacteraceae bacterium]
MSDDPFAEPNDSEATMIRPRPGGRGAGAATPAPPSVGRAAIAVPLVGANRLVAAAAPVLGAVIRLTTERGRNPDPERLKRGMIEAVREFERQALTTGLDTQSLRAARYALCATVDDMVLSTPWGAASSWTAQSLTSIFHNEVSGGERFFDILEQMQRDLGRHAEVVELMYICTSLGFEGRYRVMPRGTAALTELRDGVYRTIRQRRGEFERDLSPHWRGLATGYKPLGQRIPIWILAASTVGLACVIYVIFNFLLAASSDLAFAELNGLPPHGAISVPHPALAAPPPPPPPPPVVVAAGTTTTTMKLRQFLAPEIKQGLVVVLEDAQSITVRLTNRNMFGSGSATLNASYLPLLARIGEALNDEKGGVLVNGYTDNQPIHTVQFPSNWQLSQARADAVAKVLAAHTADPKRVKAVGKGDGDPIAPNTTPEGRQSNRRTEIVVVKTTVAP